MSDRGTFITQFFYNEALFEDVAAAIEQCGLFANPKRGDRFIAGRWTDTKDIPMDDLFELDKLFEPIAKKHGVDYIEFVIIDEQLRVWSVRDPFIPMTI